MHRFSVPVRSCVFLSLLLFFSVGEPFPGQAQPPKSRKTAVPTNKSILTKISANLGKQLNKKQKQLITEAFETLKNGLAGARTTYIQQLSEATGLSGDILLDMIPGAGEEHTMLLQKLMIPRMETKLGRPLSSNEREAIERAGMKKRETMEPLQKSFAEKVGEITNLPVPEILGLLPKTEF